MFIDAGGVCRRIFILACVSVVTACASAQAQDEAVRGNREGSLVVDGRTRTYLLHVPEAYDGTHPWPLVIVLHGGGGNAKNAQRMTGFSDLANKKGFLAVYPNGTGRLADRFLTWNAGNCCGYALDHRVNDVAFIRALIEHLQKEFKIDSRAVYVTGISNGGMLAYQLGCELSDKIAAIAPVAGAMNVDVCLPSKPVSVIAFHGTEDRHVLYQGGWPLVYYDRHERKDNSVANAMAHWVERDACDTRYQEMERGDVRVKTWSFCLEGTEVSLYTILGGGHAWPGSTAEKMWGDPPEIGRISATDIIWDFFDRHSKRDNS
ncbi:MAG: PHB depolymerase family esterase [Candidatus Omnitrophica bacterium]|nr:PHB depolymerase family esterase [Candidatus Omnitrophota bacterium]